MSFRWIISQIGARQHYGVPRGFFYRGELRLFYTEAWCRRFSSLLKMGPARSRALAGRFHRDLPASKVVSFNLRTLTDVLLHPHRSVDVAAEYRNYIRFGRAFARWVADDLSKRPLDPAQDMFFGFNTGCLETLQAMKDRKILTVCDQIDPARLEEQIVCEEAGRWPGWQKLPGRIPQEYWQRMDREWDAASIVLVNSNWSKQALIGQGVAPEKLVVIPPTFEPEKTHLPSRRNFDQPITVLWLGLVNLRKGIQYLIEAARLLETNSGIQFVVAGPILISPEHVASAPKNMQFLGKVNRVEALPLYRKADVFVLPTLSDGFAVSQLEAMSQGLPVITTPNCGEVVTTGVDGLIVPAKDPAALANAISSLEADRSLLREMSYRALDKSTCFYLPRQVQRLDEAVISLREGRPLEQTRYHIVPESAPQG